MYGLSRRSSLVRIAATEAFSREVTKLAYGTASGPLACAAVAARAAVIFFFSTYSILKNGDMDRLNKVPLTAIVAESAEAVSVGEFNNSATGSRDCYGAGPRTVPRYA